jgi:hypothetical protein
MDSRHTFKLAAIKARIEFCEAERRQIFKMMTSSLVSLDWTSERLDCIRAELHLLHRDLEAQEKLASEERG